MSRCMLNRFLLTNKMAVSFKITAFFLIVLAFFIIGCTSEVSNVCNGTGTELCPCGEGNTCNTGLVCLSDICVNPEYVDGDATDTTDSHTTDGDTDATDTTDATDGDTTDGDTTDGDTIDTDDADKEITTDGDVVDTATDGDTDTEGGDCADGCKLNEGYYCNEESNACVKLTCEMCINDDECTWPSKCRDHETADGFKICQDDAIRQECQPGYMRSGGYCVPIPRCVPYAASIGQECSSKFLPREGKLECLEGLICHRKTYTIPPFCSILCETSADCDFKFSQGCCITIELPFFCEHAEYCEKN